jgi:Flp pilus assembly protein TadD
MKKKVLVVVLFMAGFFAVKGQSLENAKKMFTYERFKNAKEELEKIVTATPNNAEAQYWLVQTLLQMGDKVSARTVANTALNASGNNPLALIAVGQVDLFENKKQEARNRFEAAISAADKKSKASILNAVGRAHGLVGISQSDPDYGIEKLKEAAKLDPKNADILVNMGNNYRRKLDGGNAVGSYLSAVALDPRNATAFYRMGQVYQTQDNCQFLKENYLNATNADPNYMPAWRELFEVYGSKESTCFNIAEAKNYLDKYLASSDPGLESDKIRMKFCYFNGDFNCAIAEADKMIATYGESADMEVLFYKAYIYKDMGDSIKATAAFDNYFAKEKDITKIGYRVYYRAAEVAAKILGNEKKSIGLYQKSIDAQPDAKLNLLAFAKIADIYDTKLKDYLNAALWYKKIIDNKEVPSASNYFSAGVAYYRANDFANGAQIFNTYADKYPTDYRGNFWAARNYAQMDTTNLGLAVPSYEKYVVIATPDSVKLKSGLVEAYRYLIAHYASKGNKDAAKGYLTKLKSLDPTNADIPTLESIINSGKQPTPTKQATPTPKPTSTPVKAGTTPATKPGTVASTTVKPPVKPPVKPVIKPATTVVKAPVKPIAVKKN